jgi:hypothetical protein
VVNLVAAWYGDEKTPMLQATAARVHGLSQRLATGGRDAAATLAALDRLATVGKLTVAIGIGDSLADLILAENRVAAHVFDTLLSWFDDRRRAASAHLAFIMSAVLLVTHATDGAGRTSSWPTLLLLARDSPELREPLFRLWHRVLDEGVLHSEAESVLTTWAGMAERDERVRDAYVRLMRAVAAHSVRTHRSIVRLANDWVSDDRLLPLPTVSAAVNDAL